MKISVTFKNPDVVHDAIVDAARKEVDQIEGLNEDDKADLVESRVERATAILDRWVKYGEYVNIEFDTIAATATVLPTR